MARELPEDRAEWEQFEKHQSVTNLVLDRIVELCYHIRRYSYACDSRRWGDFEPRENDRYDSICNLLNRLFRFDCGQLIDSVATTASVAALDIESMIRGLDSWIQQSRQEFNVTELERRLADESGYADGICLTDFFEENDDCFVFKELSPACASESKWSESRIIFNTYVGEEFDAFPDSTYFDFLPLDETVPLRTLSDVVKAVLSGEESIIGTSDDEGSSGDLVLSPLQEEILRVLNGKGMRVETLAKACGVAKNKLYRKDHAGKQPLKELIELGCVIKDRKIGYYRPDAPPPQVIKSSTRNST